MNNYKVLGLIPARGGSKGIPRKNLQPLLDKPLIAWTIEQANNSQYLSRTIVSTDDEEIATVARQHGADIPFLRPIEYAQDHSPTSEAVIHALDTLENLGEQYDYLVLLEPTSPLRKADDIDNAIQALVNAPTVDALISVGEVHMEHPLIVKKVINNQIAPYIEASQTIWQRQQVDKAYFPYGVAYMVKVENYRTEKTFYLPNTMPYFIERWQNYEIDDSYDFLITETIMKHHLSGDNL